MSGNYSFDERKIRLLLPHRPPMLFVDCVTSCNPAFDTLEAVKLISVGEPMLVRGIGATDFFPPSLMVEALAQCCGLLMNLRWLAAHGIDVAAFAVGDERAVAATRIPHSVLAETRMQHFCMVRPGESLHMTVKVKMQRGEMIRFSGTASSVYGRCAELDVLLAFPSYTSVSERAGG